LFFPRFISDEHLLRSAKLKQVWLCLACGVFALTFDKLGGISEYKTNEFVLFFSRFISDEHLLRSAKLKQVWLCLACGVFALTLNKLGGISGIQNKNPFLFCIPLDLH